MASIFLAASKIVVINIMYISYLKVAGDRAAGVHVFTGAPAKQIMEFKQALQIHITIKM